MPGSRRGRTGGAGMRTGTLEKHLFSFYLIDYPLATGRRSGAKQRASRRSSQGARPVITVEESVDNQKARLAEMARKVNRSGNLQFSAHSHRIKFRYADASGQVLTDWSRDYRAREIAEKSDFEVLSLLEGF